MKHESTSSSGMLLGMAAGAALGAVGVMAATQNQRQLRRTDSPETTEHDPFREL